MDFILASLQGFTSGIGSFLLLLGLLIFVHELGHFAAAKYFGVRVETFSLGFGPKILNYKHGDTTYAISIIPLGGYVKMYGDDPSAVLPEDQKQYSFLHKPVWPRIVIVIAGPLMNLFFAIFLFFCLGVSGERVPSTQLGDIQENTAAYASGFRSGDKVTAVNSAPVRQWKDVKELIENNADHNLTFTVERKNEESVVSAEVIATPKLIKNPFIFSTKSEVGSIEGLSLDSRAAVVGVSDPKSIAGLAGIQSLDLVEEINGEKVGYWRDLAPMIKSAMFKAAETGKMDITVRSTADIDSDKEAPLRKLTITREMLAPITKNSATRAVEPSDLGLSDPQTFLSTVKKGSPGLSMKAAVSDSPATKAGLKSGDQLVEINGVQIKTWEDVLSQVKGYKESPDGLKVSYRRDGEVKTVSVYPEMTEIPDAQGGLDKRYAIGITPAILNSANPPTTIKYGPGEALMLGVKQSYDFSVLIGMSMVRLITGDVSARNVGGVITIGRVAKQSIDAGWDIFVKTMAVISINLFLLNLLPVPVLDGGHLLFFTIEAIKGTPISLKKLEVAQQVGLALLLSLMVFALFNDITHWISSR